MQLNKKFASNNALIDYLGERYAIDDIVTDAIAYSSDDTVFNLYQESLGKNEIIGMLHNGVITSSLKSEEQILLFREQNNLYSIILGCQGRDSELLINHFRDYIDFNQMLYLDNIPSRFSFSFCRGKPFNVIWWESCTYFLQSRKFNAKLQDMFYRYITNYFPTNISKIDC